MKLSFLAASAAAALLVATGAFAQGTGGLKPCTPTQQAARGNDSGASQLAARGNDAGAAQMAARGNDSGAAPSAQLAAASACE